MDAELELWLAVTDTEPDSTLELDTMELVEAEVARLDLEEPELNRILLDEMPLVEAVLDSIPLSTLLVELLLLDGTLLEDEVFGVTELVVVGGPSVRLVG